MMCKLTLPFFGFDVIKTSYRIQVKDRPCFQGQVGKLDDLMCRGAFIYSITFHTFPYACIHSYCICVYTSYSQHTAIHILLIA